MAVEWQWGSASLTFIEVSCNWVYRPDIFQTEYCGFQPDGSEADKPNCLAASGLPTLRMSLRISRRNLLALLEVAQVLSVPRLADSKPSVQIIQGGGSTTNNSLRDFSGFSGPSDIRTPCCVHVDDLSSHGDDLKVVGPCKYIADHTFALGLFDHVPRPTGWSNKNNHGYMGVS